MDRDLEVRLAAFRWLAEQTRIHGDVLPRKLLQIGFLFEEMKVSLVSPQGIHKPKLLDIPLSIATTPNSPYEDRFNEDNLLVYRYRGSNPLHRDNVGLRQAFENRRPLVYFHGIVPGRYMAVWPVYIVSDNVQMLSFTVAVDEMASLQVDANPTIVITEQSETKRAYLTATIRQRLHQRDFREKVLRAYRSQCAFCRLKHRELLDASHIIPDHLEDGMATVNNGMALCKLHHAAFDSFLLGVTPDYKIVVRDDILVEVDGPLLKHGLQALHGENIALPRQATEWPNRNALAWRFDKFLRSTT